MMCTGRLAEIILLPSWLLFSAAVLLFFIKTFCCIKHANLGLGIIGVLLLKTSPLFGRRLGISSSGLCIEYSGAHEIVLLSIMYKATQAY